MAYHIPEQKCTKCGEVMRPALAPNTRSLFNEPIPVPMWEVYGKKILCCKCSWGLWEKFEEISSILMIKCPKDGLIPFHTCDDCDYGYGHVYGNNRVIHCTYNKEKNNGD